MEKIYIFCPSSLEEYRHLLELVGPKLDDAGISFHICRPEKDIAGRILSGEEVNI